MADDQRRSGARHVAVQRLQARAGRRWPAGRRAGARPTRAETHNGVQHGASQLGAEAHGVAGREELAALAASPARPRPPPRRAPTAAVSNAGTPLCCRKTCTINWASSAGLRHGQDRAETPAGGTEVASSAAAREPRAAAADRADGSSADAIVGAAVTAVDSGSVSVVPSVSGGHRASACLRDDLSRRRRNRRRQRPRR